MCVAFCTLVCTFPFLSMILPRLHPFTSLPFFSSPRVAVVVVQRLYSGYTPSPLPSSSLLPEWQWLWCSDYIAATPLHLSPVLLLSPSASGCGAATDELCIQAARSRVSCEPYSASYVPNQMHLRAGKE